MRKITDKDYEIPARFTDHLVISGDPDAPPLPKWKQEIWDKIHAAKTFKEVDELLDLIYGESDGELDEDLEKTIELFESEE